MSRKEEIKKLHDILVRRRDALRQALAGDLSALKELREQAGGDVIDIALDSAQDEISSRLAEVESRELAQIERALERMREGTYGQCEVSGKPIPLDRLRALPYATMCVEVQRELEQGADINELAADWGRVVDLNPDDTPASINDVEMNH